MKKSFVLKRQHDGKKTSICKKETFQRAEKSRERNWLQQKKIEGRGFIVIMSKRL